jgi:hypothetical protein
MLDWHHVDHHQITSTAITWNQDCPPWPAGRGSTYQGRATAATEGTWTPAGKGVKTVMQLEEYRPSKRVEDQEAGPVGGAGTWPMRPAAPGKAYRTRYRQNLWYRRENFDIIIQILHWYYVRHQGFCLRYPYILTLQYNFVPVIDSKLWYRIHIECTKTVEIEYLTQSWYRRVFFNINTISSVQRLSFWCVLNTIVPDTVHDIDALSEF